MPVEYIQFAGAIIFLIAALVGSYWFVYAPVRRENKKNEEGHSDGGTH